MTVVLPMNGSAVNVNTPRLKMNLFLEYSIDSTELSAARKFGKLPYLGMRVISKCQTLHNICFITSVYTV